MLYYKQRVLHTEHCPYLWSVLKRTQWTAQYGSQTGEHQWMCMTCKSQGCEDMAVLKSPHPDDSKLSLAQLWHCPRQRYSKIRQSWLCRPVCGEREHKRQNQFVTMPASFHLRMLYKNDVLDTSMAFLSRCVFAMDECTDKNNLLSIILIWWLLHAVHGVVWHQSKRWHLSWYTGWR